MSRSASPTPSNASDASATSTVVYGQIPWTEYEPKVRALCKTIWPFASPEATILERIPGGWYNRIVGVDVDDARRDESATKESGRFILRIPRMPEDGEDIADQVALLRYIAARSTIPVPLVIQYDLTTETRWKALTSPRHESPGAIWT